MSLRLCGPLDWKVLNRTGEVPAFSRLGNAGVAVFNQSTKPTARTGSEALVLGDLWTDSATGIEWFWSGTQWLTTQLGTFRFALTSQNGGQGSVFKIPMQTSPTVQVQTYNVLVLDLNWVVATGTADDVSNYWYLKLAWLSASNVQTNIATLTSAGCAASGWTKYNTTLNTLLDVSALGLNSFLFELGSIGSSGNYYGGANSSYRLAYP